MKAIIILRYLRSILYKCFFLVVLFPSAQAGDTSQLQPLIFSILPYTSAGVSVDSYKPLTAYLSHSTGLQINIQISKDSSSHISLIAED